ncbi:MAG: DUF1730 domain-containing protein [Ignavibacteriales bacterium]|nr:DUF1730 domain-containing protein [Ignavibacteriales bacterium]
MAACRPGRSWSSRNLYNTDHPRHVEMADPARARIARYAWGDDYHGVMGRRLGDTGPVDARRGRRPDSTRAGAWTTGPCRRRCTPRGPASGGSARTPASSTPRSGPGSCSACWPATVDLEPDEAAVDRCGTCRLCLDACPTGAFVEPYVLDARRCLSLPDDRDRGRHPGRRSEPALGAHIFGCDICQDVCPYNAVAPSAGDACWQPRPVFEDARLETLWANGRRRARSGHRGHRASPRRRARTPPEPRRRHRQRRPDADVSPRMRKRCLAPFLTVARWRMRGPSLRDPMVAEHVAWARSRSG